MVIIFYAIADLSNVDPFFAIGRNLDLAITQIVQLTIGVVHADLRDASRLTQLICDVTAFLRIILETRYRVKLTIKRIEQRAGAAGIICAAELMPIVVSTNSFSSTSTELTVKVFRSKVTALSVLLISRI